tara:strand:- start:99 stop:248 length:150 start_codon:yes stop_codon:yes gene_type:complete
VVEVVVLNQDLVQVVAQVVVEMVEVDLDQQLHQEQLILVVEVVVELMLQ